MDTVRTYKRAYYRLRYPSSMRPSIRIQSVDYEVAELSERGMRVVMPRDVRLEKGTPIEGIIRFYDRQTSEIKGSVLRRDKDEVVFSIDSGISYKRMLDEQMAIVHKYPSYFSKPE
ncbi:MAG: PilZ domain-containing protein [Planctomycetota bacterium]